MIFKSMTLLSEEEREKYKLIIPKIQQVWWLRTPAANDEKRVRVVDDVFNEVFDFHHQLDNVSIRPCCVFELVPDDPAYWKRPDLLIGSKVKHGRYTWTVLDIVFGNILAICDTAVLDGAFDLKANAWETSEIKAWFDAKGEKIIT